MAVLAALYRTSSTGQVSADQRSDRGRAAHVSAIVGYLRPLYQEPRLHLRSRWWDASFTSRSTSSRRMSSRLLWHSRRNVHHIHERFKPGLKFCAKKVLRAGIVLLGFRLSLSS